MSLTALPPSTTGEILARVIRPEESDLTPAAAKGFLGFAFNQADRDRMHVLARMNQEGSLKRAERRQLEAYLQVGMMLDLLQAKARLTLSRSSRRTTHG